MKFYLKLFATLIAVILNVTALRASFWLMNEPSEIAIIIALCMMLIIGILDWEFYKQVWRRKIEIK